MESEGLRQRKGLEKEDAKSENDEKDDLCGKNEGLREEKNGEEGDIKAGSYWLTRIVFLRFLAFIYLVAFLVSYHQNKELIGDRGLSPARLFLRRVGEEFWELKSKMLHLPTILWFAGEVSNHGKGGELDVFLDGIALTGAFLAILVMVRGAANMMVMATMWILYMSIVNVGQNWFSFGWESQLLETGFLAIWAVPLFSLSRFPSHLPPPSLVIWGNRWLIFRIMIGAGLIKLRGDQCWKDLTCMNYFYQTQPNPNPISYFAHQAPEGWHMFETFGNHMIELVFPLLTFVPIRGGWIFNGCWQIIFQLVLISTGNLSFLNWLTIAPSIWYLDDRFLSSIFSAEARKHVKELQKEDEVSSKPRTNWLRRLVNLVVGLGIAWLSLPIVANLASPNQAMNRSFDPLRLVNTYGAFGSVTKERTEVVLEGTTALNPEDPAAKWEAYEFKCKPGRLTRAPCFISPYHYRLDWLMWFAAFQKYQQNPWLVHLMGKMLENDPIVDSLLAENPFKGKQPPKHVRARHFKYTFTRTGDTKASKGKWWSRKLLGDYVPPLNLASLEPIYRQFGWSFMGR